MKIIYKIAKAELQSLFFSPIAWLILILYTFQTGMDFAGLVDGVMKGREMGYGVTNGTSRFFGGWDGVLTVVQGYLYLYIPLLTMNLMSRELGSGSIKLLYSSPVTNVQIILGKYLSMLIYALVLVGILVLYVIIGAIIIKNFDYPQVLTGLLGIYFLICAYAAIGLLMSSLTSYQVVAAVGTLAVLSLLTYVDLLVGYAWAFSGVFVRNGLQCKCYLFIFGDSTVFGNGNHSSAVQKTKEQMDGYLGKIFGCLGYCIASWICHFASGFQKLL